MAKIWELIKKEVPVQLRCMRYDTVYYRDHKYKGWGALVLRPQG